MEESSGNASESFATAADSEDDAGPSSFEHVIRQDPAPTLNLSILEELYNSSPSQFPDLAGIQQDIVALPWSPLTFQMPLSGFDSMDLADDASTTADISESEGATAPSISTAPTAYTASISGKDIQLPSGSSRKLEFAGRQTIQESKRPGNDAFPDPHEVSTDDQPAQRSLSPVLDDDSSTCSIGSSREATSVPMTPAQSLAQPVDDPSSDDKQRDFWEPSSNADCLGTHTSVDNYSRSACLDFDFDFDFDLADIGPEDFEVFEPEVPYLSASFECEIGEVLRCQNNPGIEVLLNHVIIIRSAVKPNGARDDGPYLYKATTCDRYLATRWGPLGKSVLSHIYQLFANDAKSAGAEDGGFSAFNFLASQSHQYRLQLDAEQRGLELTVDSEADHLVVKGHLDVLDFLCRAIRGPQNSQGATLSASTFADFEWSDSHDAFMRDFAANTRSPFKLIRVPIEHSEPTSGSPNCWRQLFQNFTVLDDKDSSLTHITKNNGKGLELSLDLMLTLAAATNVLPIDQGVMFFGYKTALLPEYICEEHNYVQYHLEVAHSDQIDPIAKARGRVAPIADPSKLLAMRCFLGWTACADILLGSGRLPLNIKHSGAKPVQQSIHLKEFTFGLQAASTVVGQFGVTTEATFGFISHRLMFSPPSDFEDLLSRTAKQVALIVDVKAERSWLVPKLSLLLHLAHVYMSSHKIQTAGLPYVDPHNDPQAVVDALSGKAENVIYGTGRSARRLGPFLIDLNRDLIPPRHEELKAKAGSLKGLELMDIIDRPDRGACPRNATAGERWAHLANLVDVTVVCSEIGSIIEPSQSYRCPNEKCNILPSGKDYLAAPTSCLGRLTEKTKDDINSLRLAPGVDLTDGKILLITGTPFGTCQHSLGTTGSCWTRPAMFQSVQEDRWLNKLRKSKSCMASLTLPEKGAVVFGKRLKELTSDQSMITITSGQAQVA